MTLLRASVMKLINGGMRAEQVLTKQVSLSLSHYVVSSLFPPQPCCPISPLPLCALIRLDYTEVLSFIIGMNLAFLCGLLIKANREE